MRRIILSLFILLLFFSTLSIAQDRAILVPKSLSWTPYAIDDSEDLFGKAWRFYREGFTESAKDSLIKLINSTGFKLKPNNYYIVVANFTETETPIGMIHGDQAFHNNRLYGLKSDSLYYIFISRDDSAKSYLSASVESKGSYFDENLVNFISLFPIFSQVQATAKSEYRTWIDIRKFTIPKNFQKNCDINIIIKKDFYDEEFLAREVFDNTSLEKWSYGIGTAITTMNDVDIIVDGGTIVVRPKPRGDLATFGLINYHFKPVDTKDRTIASSFHVAGGLRISNTLEPIIGIGFGIPADFIELHLFGGLSVELAQELNSGYKIGDIVSKEEDPFSTKVRAKARIGIEIKFP